MAGRRASLQGTSTARAALQGPCKALVGSLACIASGGDAKPPRFQILSEQIENKVASPWILQSVLCWQAVALTANISWVLASGTLLGAIRNKNVIPWDGDADAMCM